ARDRQPQLDPDDAALARADRILRLGRARGRRARPRCARARVPRAARRRADGGRGRRAGGRVVTRDMRQAFGATVSDLVERDERVAVVLAEISTSYLERAMAAHPDRVVDAGIMEQTMVAVAAGFAMEGFHPIAHSLSPFMSERPYEQLKLDFGYQGLGGTVGGPGGSYDHPRARGDQQSQ